MTQITKKATTVNTTTTTKQNKTKTKTNKTKNNYVDRIDVGWSEFSSDQFKCQIDGLKSGL